MGEHGSSGLEPNSQTKHKNVSFKRQLADMKLHEKVDFLLHRPVVEYLVIVLIVIDSLIVVASLMLEIKILEAELEECQNHATEKSHLIHSLEEAVEGLHITSLVILALFFFEILLKLYGQRMRFFQSKVQVVDSFIVAISLALDIAVVVIQNVDSTVANGLGLIIILRLWRVVRIVNGAIVATKTELEERMHHQTESAERAKEEAFELKALLSQRDREIDFLKSRLAKYEPIDMLPAGSTRIPPYLPESTKIPSRVLGDTTDDEDSHVSAFSEVNQSSRRAMLPNTYNGGPTAFQVYQPGVTYQPTSQFPVDEIKSRQAMPYTGGTGAAYVVGNQTNYSHDMPMRHQAAYVDDLADTADESDVVSIKPSKSRSGNTFTVKKDGVPMTSL